MISVFFSAQLLTHLFFIWAQKIKNWGVIDIAWGLGFIVTTSTAALVFKNCSFSALLVLSMTALWGGRLAVYLFIRNHGKSEDWRYKQLRQEWKPNENVQSYFKVFVLQGVLMFLISLPQIKFIECQQSLEFNFREVLGFIIWITGMTFEILADFQLAKFKKDISNKGRIMTQGVWSFSRHPNYFGEVSLWWGFYLMVCTYVPWWTILGPLLITFFIANVSGIPLLEEKYKNNLDFQKYKERTNMFFPWFPKQD